MGGAGFEKTQALDGAGGARAHAGRGARSAHWNVAPDAYVYVPGGGAMTTRLGGRAVPSWACARQTSQTLSGRPVSCVRKWVSACANAAACPNNRVRAKSQERRRRVGMGRILTSRRIDGRDRVVTVIAAGAAAADAFRGQPAAFEHAVFFDGFLTVFRTGRQVTTLPPQPGRKCQLVDANRADEEFLREIHSCAPAWLDTWPDDDHRSLATNSGSRSRTMNTKRLRWSSSGQVSSRTSGYSTCCTPCSTTGCGSSFRFTMALKRSRFSARKEVSMPSADCSP